MKKSSRSGKKSKKVTLADVAAAAGCSKSAVSYAILRNHPIGKALRQRIAQVVDELGYKPYTRRSNPAKPQAVAVICDTQKNNGGTPRLFYRALLKRGFEMILVPLDDDFTPEKLRRVAMLLKENKALCGIINTHSAVQTLDLSKLCRDLPVVMYDRLGSMYSCGGTDFGKMVQMAAHHFAEHGFTRAAFLFHEKTMENFRAVGQGALAEMTEKLTVKWVGIPHGEPVQQVTEILDRCYDDGGIRAYFIQNTRQASAVLYWAYRKNLRVPEDLSLLVIDYCDNADHAVPPLNSLSLPKKEMVEHTVEALMAKMAEKETDAPVFAVTLVDRGTVAFVKS